VDPATDDDQLGSLKWKVTRGPRSPTVPGLLAALDEPVENSVHEGWVMVSGWVVPPDGWVSSSSDVSRGASPVVVEVRFDGQLIDTTPADLARGDVADALQRPEVIECGFRIDLEVPFRSAGECDVTVGVRWDSVSDVMASFTMRPTNEPLSLVGSRSQAGEDTLLRRLLGDQVPRFLVDVGAHDGVMLSNSYTLLAEGWAGVLVEPLPTVFDRLVSNHRRHPGLMCRNVACGDVEGMAELFVGTDGPTGQNSTLCRDDNEWMRAARSSRSIKVPVRRLSALLDECGHDGEIGLLLVDCEGMDYEALCGLDPRRHRPWVVVTELYLSNMAKHEAKQALLRSWGLQLVETIAYNEVWADPSLL
jgi:FkbM family methyltransferase